MVIFPADACHRILVESEAKTILKQMRTQISQPNQAFSAVLWVRHHWVAAVFREDSKAWDVYDSARSGAVERDLYKLAKQLGREPPNMRPCAQQHRGTSECGLFAAANIWIIHAGHSVPANTGKVSLAELRSLYPDVERMKRRAFEILHVEGHINVIQVEGEKTLKEVTHATKNTQCVWAHDPYGSGRTRRSPIQHFDKLDRFLEVSQGSVDQKKPEPKPQRAVQRQSRTSQHHTAPEPSLHINGNQARGVDGEGSYTSPTGSFKTSQGKGVQTTGAGNDTIIIDEPQSTNQAEQRAQTLLEKVYLLEGKIREVRRLREPGTMALTETIDESLMREALEHAGLDGAQRAGVDIRSALSRKPFIEPPRGAHQNTQNRHVFQPIWHNHHFILLYWVVGAKQATIYDSLTNYHIQERNNVAKSLLPGGTSINTVYTGPQARNDCAFMATAAFARQLSRLGGREPLSYGRVQAVDRLLYQMEEQLKLAREDLQKDLEVIESNAAANPTQARDQIKDPPEHLLRADPPVDKPFQMQDNQLRCHEGHHMQRVSTLPRSKDGFTCNLCQTFVCDVRSTEIFRCPICDFDLCSSCKENWESGRPVGVDQFDETSTSLLEHVISTCKCGDRIKVPWVFRERGMHIITWIGTVTREFDSVSRSIQVAWDSGLEKLSGNRRRPFPPADLPDPKLRFGVPVISADTSAEQQSKDNTPTAQPRLCFGVPAISRPFIEDTHQENTEERQNTSSTHTMVTATNPSRIITRSALQVACRRANLDNSLVRITIGPSAIMMAERPDTHNQSKEEWKESCTRTCLGHIIREGRDYAYTICAEQCKSCGAWTSEEEDGIEEEKDELLVNLLDPDFTCRDFQIVQETPQVLSTCACHDFSKAEISSNAKPSKADVTPLENGTEFKSFRDETQPDASLGFAASAPYPADIAKAWYVFNGRPPHIQTIVWRQLAESTRATHARWIRKLRTIPITWAKSPLGSAIVQLVLTEATRARWTSWATIACALSSFASALKRLPEYTNAMNSIDLSKDSVFSSALKRALQLARVTKRHSSQETLTPVQFDELYRHIKDEEVRLLFALTWFFAGRVGDMRQIIAGDVEVGGDIVCTNETKTLVTITFRAGKGAAFWGPYSIQSLVPQHVAKALSSIKRRRGINCHMFSELQQSHLSRIFNDFFKESSGLRSIRRGRLISLALEGVSDGHLKLLSGHKRMDTLMRYLGWGRHSSDAREAALARENRVLGAGALEPPKMGPWSGFGGKRGKRIHRPPPELWPRRPPKARDLGIEPQKETTQSWPLKAKPSIGLGFQGIQRLLPEEQNDSQTAELREKLRMVTEWCSGRTLQTELGNRRAYKRGEVPVSHISRQDFDTLTGAGKLAPLEEGEQIRGWAAGYLIPQVKKKQRRPVWEGQINQESLWLPHVTYPARRVRRMLRGFAYTADFDFEGWFDQFHLENLAQLYHVVRYQVKEKDGSLTEAFVKLTRLPMGDRQAPGIAQYVTDILIAPFLHMENVKVFSMIDNIRIAARDRHTFMTAVKTFVARCKTAGATLNPLEWPVANSTTTDSADSQLHETNVEDMNDELWEAYGKADGKVFLGEQYITNEHGEHGTRNTPKNVDKLREALSLANKAKEDTRGYTHRNIVSLIGLMLWMSHTLDIHLCNLRDILDSYAKISQRAIYAGWDSDLTYVDSRLLQKINALGDTLCKNEITALPLQPSEPSNRNEDYDVVIITDACETGWAAFVHLVASGKTQLIKQRWAPHHKSFHLSTITEPAAATIALDWVREQLGPDVRIALITDHSPIVQGQPRWWNQQGGFSVNPWLNECYRRMLELHVQAFHIRGDQNPADAPSRDTLTARYDTISVTEILGHWVSASLSQLEHPFIAPRETFKWQG